MFPGGGYGGGGYGGGYGGGGSYSSIPLDVKIPQFPSAAQYVGQMVSLQDAMARRQLTQAEVQNQNLLAQERQRDLGSGPGLAGLIAANTQQPTVPPAANSSMAAAVAPFGDFGGEAGPATPVQAGPTSDAQYKAAAAQHQIGDIHGYPVTDWNAVERGAVAGGWGPQFYKLRADQRANETAALTQQQEATKNWASNANNVAQIVTPFATAVRGQNPDPTQLQESWRQTRNQLLTLPGPGPNGKMFTEAQLPNQYTDTGAGGLGKPADWAGHLFDSNPDAQRVAANAVNLLKNTQEAVQGNLKTVEDQTKFGRTAVASSPTQDDLNHQVLLAKQGGVPNEMIGNLFPVARDANGQMLVAKNGVPIVQYSDQARAAAQQALIPPQDQTRDLQGRLQMTGPLLATAFDKDQDAMGPGQVDPSLATPSDRANYTAARNQLAPDLKRFFPESPTDRDQIIRSGMTGTQTESAEARDARIAQGDARVQQGQQNADTHSMMAGIAADRAANNQSGVRQDLLAKNKAQAAANQAWGLNRKMEIAASTPAGSQYSDPRTGTTRTMPADTLDSKYNHSNPVRDELRAGSETARQQALDSQQQSDELQAKHGWGNSAPGAKPAAPAAAAPSGQTPPPPQRYAEADIRARARTRGLDENAAVSLARQKGLLQ
jgi:hypothetical protein